MHLEDTFVQSNLCAFNVNILYMNLTYGFSKTGIMLYC